MRIGELARQAGVDPQTVRYYERQGLLDPPARTPAGYRAYGPAHLERLQFVRHCRSLDIPLADIRRLLALARTSEIPCEEVDRLVETHLARVRARRAALETLERQLARLRAQCAAADARTACGILQALIAAGRGEACACHAAGTPR